MNGFLGFLVIVGALAAIYGAGFVLQSVRKWSGDVSRIVDMVLIAVILVLIYINLS